MTETLQAPLFIEEPLDYEYREVKVEEVLREDWGSPPDDQLKRNVAATGPIFPIIFERVAGTDKLRIVEGRRRFQAAEEAGFAYVRGLIALTDVAVALHTVHLSGNAHSSQNRVMDLFAIEELMVSTGERDAGEIARRARIPLKDVNKILGMQLLLGELRDAARAGTFTNAVAVAAAKLEPAQQRKLLKILNANGTITAKDVQDVKRTEVKTHQRTLPDDNWRQRARDLLRKAHNEVFSAEGEDHPAWALIKQAIEALGSEE